MSRLCCNCTTITVISAVIATLGTSYALYYPWFYIGLMPSGVLDGYVYFHWRGLTVEWTGLEALSGHVLQTTDVPYPAGNRSIRALYMVIHSYVYASWICSVVTLLGTLYLLKTKWPMGHDRRRTVLYYSVQTASQLSSWMGIIALVWFSEYHTKALARDWRLYLRSDPGRWAKDTHRMFPGHCWGDGPHAGLGPVFTRGLSLDLPCVRMDQYYTFTWPGGDKTKYPSSVHVLGPDWPVFPCDILRDFNVHGSPRRPGDPAGPCEEFQGYRMHYEVSGGYLWVKWFITGAPVLMVFTCLVQTVFLVSFARTQNKMSSAHYYARLDSRSAPPPGGVYIPVPLLPQFAPPGTWVAHTDTHLPHAGRTGEHMTALSTQQPTYSPAIPLPLVPGAHAS